MGDTMPATRPSQLLTLQSFGDISRFLREGVADEDSRQLRDSLGALSSQIDEAVRIRRTSSDTTEITRRVVTLSHSAREHQLFLTGLGSAWHALYEFGAYQRALRELRNAIADWQLMLERRSTKESESFDQFELLAWRTLGEALLLIDMYEHQSNPCERLARRAAAAQALGVAALACMVSGGAPVNRSGLALLGRVDVVHLQHAEGAELPHSCATLLSMQIRSAFYFWFFISVPGG